MTPPLKMLDAPECAHIATLDKVLCTSLSPGLLRQASRHVELDGQLRLIRQFKGSLGGFYLKQLLSACSVSSCGVCRPLVNPLQMAAGQPSSACRESTEHCGTSSVPYTIEPGEEPMPLLRTSSGATAKATIGMLSVLVWRHMNSTRAVSSRLA